jgi:hypothetical protein
MTCAVPSCQQPTTMEGVCTAHWLEADEAVNGAARLDAAIAEQHEVDQARAAEDRERLKEAARLRALDPQHDRVDRVLDKIVERFWQEASAESGRNRALAGAAWAAGRLVAGGELDEARAVQVLVHEGHASGLPSHECTYVVKKQIARARTRPRALARTSTWASDWGTRW